MEMGNNSGSRSIHLKCNFMRYSPVHTNRLRSNGHWDKATSKYNFKVFSEVEKMYVSSKLEMCHPFLKFYAMMTAFEFCFSIFAGEGIVQNFSQIPFSVKVWPDHRKEDNSNFQWHFAWSVVCNCKFQGVFFWGRDNACVFKIGNVPSF